MQKHDRHAGKCIEQKAFFLTCNKLIKINNNVHKYKIYVPLDILVIQYVHNYPLHTMKPCNPIYNFS